VQGRKTTISIPVCTSGAASFGFDAAPLGGLGDGRGVAARVGTIRYVPNAAACKTASHRSNS
jgi:hypothetical protein